MANDWQPARVASTSVNLVSVPIVTIVAQKVDAQATGLSGSLARGGKGNTTIVPAVLVSIESAKRRMSGI